MNKHLKIFVPIFLILLFSVASIKPLIQTSESISNKVLRLHILANSDKDNDQELKLAVKDEVLNRSKEIFQNSENLEGAIKNAKENLVLLQNVANNVVKNAGYNYPVKVYLDEEYFETRYYNGFIMPAGKYNTIKIVIGNGEGHNWWCVMYPSVCLSGCVDDFDIEMNEEEKEMLISSKFTPKFKIIEFYESIKNKILS